jgi:hypothetical protein
MLQAGWCIIYGVFSFQDGYSVVKPSSADLGCFLSLGTYSVCSDTIFFSVESSLFFLMAQALISRVLVPGVSIFVNASVRCPPHCIRHFQITTSRPEHLQTARAQKHLTCAADIGLRQAATCCK